MAWKAVITGWDLIGPSVSVGYYDDADPDVVLYTHAFQRADVSDFRAQVIQVGQRARTAHQRLQAIKAQGAIAIP